MPETNGTLVWMTPNQVDAHFNIDGPNYTCSLKTNSEIPYFNLRSAKLNYDNTGQLSGKRSLDGHVGKNNFVTSFDNSSKIEGDLSDPIDEVTSFYGNAIWTQTM